MALHFVSTSILSSSDGIDYNDETHRESEESRTARLKAETGASKPLYMQLADREEEKKADYDAMTKKIFAPPRALDEEDCAFYTNLEENKERLAKIRKADEKLALAAFRAHRAEEAVSAQPQALSFISSGVTKKNDAANGTNRLHFVVHSINY
jgi:hypothetical protein